MPVAVDAAGNMCIVVMFSPNNIQSSDEAMEYLQSLSLSATSTSIPCILPVTSNTGSSERALFHPLPPSTSSPSGTASSNQLVVPQNSLGEGVTARFVSLDDINNTENHSHELSQAPKDTFGIPMLPTVAELGSGSSAVGNVTPDEAMDVFDEASYGIWNTIMDDFFQDAPTYDSGSSANGGPVASDPSLQVVLPDQHLITESRKERLDEFLSAFLSMSVFDVADVWVPAATDGYPECLRHVMSVMTGGITGNDRLHEFQIVSEHALIKFWTGGVGRAYSSGNPVWSCNPQVFVDAGRVVAFEEAGIQTVLAVPVFSARQTLPACVVSCYSLVKSNSVPFVLRFVQQALRLLWEGLDNFEPQNQSVKDRYWRKINPADLGEMAADVEMQQHFVQRKRPHSLIHDGPYEERRNSFVNFDAGRDLGQESDQLASHFQSIRLPNGDLITIPLQLTEDDQQQGQTQHSTVPTTAEVHVDTVQQHLAQAIQSVQEAVPFPDHVSTGAKRVHIMPPSPVKSSQPLLGPINTPGNAFMPLPMPRPFPSHVVKASVVSLNSSNHSAVSLASTTNASTSTANAGSYPVSPQQPLNGSSDPSPVLFKSSEILNQQRPPPLRPEGAPELTTVSLSSTHQNGEEILPEKLKQQLNLGALEHQQIRILSSNSLADSDASMTEEAFCQVVSSNLSIMSTKTCRIIGCEAPAMSRRPYCEAHSGNRICEFDGCNKCAQGCTRFCIAHGGGRRCTFPGCDKGARDKFFCAAHGGGKRCRHEGCTKSAVGGSDLCTAHGGGRRCEVEGCDKSAQSSTRFCVKHGGGKKCAHSGCEKVARGRTNYCAAHGGGVRCKLEGCNRVAIGKLQLCRAHGGSSSRARKSRDGERSPDFDRDQSTSPTPVHQLDVAFPPTQPLPIDSSYG
jgi:hypothetical protein